MNFENVSHVTCADIKELFDILKLNPLYSAMEYRDYWFNIDPSTKVIFGNAKRQTAAEFKIKVMNSKTINLLWNHVNRGQIEKKFDGLASDLAEPEFANNHFMDLHNKEHQFEDFILSKEQQSSINFRNQIMNEIRYIAIHVDLLNKKSLESQKENMMVKEFPQAHLTVIKQTGPESLTKSTSDDTLRNSMPNLNKSVPQFNSPNRFTTPGKITFPDNYNKSNSESQRKDLSKSEPNHINSVTPARNVLNEKNHHNTKVASADANDKHVIHVKEHIKIDPTSTESVEEQIEKALPQIHEKVEEQIEKVLPKEQAEHILPQLDDIVEEKIEKALPEIEKKIEEVPLVPEVEKKMSVDSVDSVTDDSKQIDDTKPTSSTMSKAYPCFCFVIAAGLVYGATQLEFPLNEQYTIF